jgi:hypothetical protein
MLQAAPVSIILWETGAIVFLMDSEKVRFSHGIKIFSFKIIQHPVFYPTAEKNDLDITNP